ncbi:hypothetical protein MYX82_11515 [Acidobacteria bacterium AH-259-D05]|nr:hypothetical protein [Acidobacteria bacterium AH-259-D05]
MNEETTQWRKHQGIPDPQVKDAADQYESARKLLASRSPGSGVLLPLMNVAAVAIELYLKCLSAELVHTPDHMVSGVSVVSAKPVKGHILTRLFDEIFDDLQRDLERTFRTECPGHGELSFREALERCEGAFAESRYPFEQGSNISKYSLELLLCCSQFLEKYVAAREPSEYIEWR